MRRKSKNLRKEDILLLLSVCFFLYLPFLFSPYENFLLNQNDFNFSFSDFWHITVVFSFAILIIILEIGIVQLL